MSSIQLARAAAFVDTVVVIDNRFSERRFRLYGWIDGLPHCAAVTLRAGRVRVISIRRAHAKEFAALATEAPIVFDDHNPEWTEADFARARPASELPPHFLAAFPRSRGAQKAPTKQQVTLRLDRDVVEKFRATGRGWQARINAALKEAQP